MASATTQILNQVSTDSNDPAVVTPQAGSSEHQEQDVSSSTVNDLDGVDNPKESPPDFIIYSIPDYPQHFHVHKKILINGSEMFSDMFSVCDTTKMDDEQQNKMDMPETAEVLGILLRLLENPIVPYKPEQNDIRNEDLPPEIPLDKAIPLPLLRQLFELADKYMLHPPIVATLQSHLVAHESSMPLEVYAMAINLNFPTIAARASAHLHSPPMHKYSASQLSILPSIESLHRLYVLQAHRIQCLREIVAKEEIFPHNYGACPTKGHTDRTRELWMSRKTWLLMGRIEAGTDVAGEVRTPMITLADCKTCTAAYDAAVEMLRYKCRKVPRKTTGVPQPT